MKNEKLVFVLEGIFFRSTNLKLLFITARWHPYKQTKRIAQFALCLFEYIDNHNFNIQFILPELASSLFGNAVKILCAQAQACALPEQH